MLEFRTIQGKVQNWAIERGLDNADSQGQLLKLIEEVGEIAGALTRNNMAGVKDGIGDAIVVLIILCMQQGITIDQCLNMAWNEIKDRKGIMIDGVFVKLSDLEKKSNRPFKSDLIHNQYFSNGELIHEDTEDVEFEQLHLELEEAHDMAGDLI